MRIRQGLLSSLLHSEIKQINPSPLRLRARVFLLAAVLLLFLLSAGDRAFARSATWKLNATDEFWYTASNWRPATVPNGPGDTATFDVSNTTGISVQGGTTSDPVEVNEIVFNADASPFTLNVNPSADFDQLLTISGVGITNNSGIIQNFKASDGEGVPGVIQFTNSATAGNLTVFTNGVNPFQGIPADHTDFFDTSSAGSATFYNNEFCFTSFFDSATADNAVLIANGATIATFPGGETIFNDTSDAGNATLIANPGSNGGLGGSIELFADSTGGHSRVEIFGNGNLDISGHNAPGVAVGSIEGSGDVFLGANNLTVGAVPKHNFSGVIQDGGLFGGTGGSLTKIGGGSLRLTNANLYTGGTTVNDGTLEVDNMTGSGTGTGLVQFNAGRLAGKGTIAGAVILGTGSGPGAVLSPGKRDGRDIRRPITIQSALTFNSDATYDFELRTDSATAGKVVANGVTISGAFFSFAALGGSVLPLGSVFTAINNTAATPISGTFSNLADGSTFTVGSNTFQASYEGGDGNDLTLTVVP